MLMFRPDAVDRHKNAGGNDCKNKERKLESKTYYSIEGQRTVDVKIKRSDFICTMKNVASMELAKAFISKIAKENKTATHNCWAYIIGSHGNTFHSSDAGEPSGTAGKPMLNMLQSYNMTCVAAVVTRIFGGVKLGVRGLMDAYGYSVQKAIELKPLIKVVSTQDFIVEVPYPLNDTLLYHFSTIKGIVLNTRYEENIIHVFRVETDDVRKCYELLDTFQKAGRLKFECDMETGGETSC